MKRLTWRFVSAFCLATSLSTSVLAQGGNEKKPDAPRGSSGGNVQGPGAAAPRGNTPPAANRGSNAPSNSGPRQPAPGNNTQPGNNTPRPNVRSETPARPQAPAARPEAPARPQTPAARPEVPARPDTNAPGATRPQTKLPGANKPGSNLPGNNLPGANRQRTDKPVLPGNDLPGTNRRPGADKPDAPKPDAALPGRNQPKTDKPVLPGDDLPGTNRRPGADKPDAPKPDAALPGRNQPKTDKPVLPGNDLPGANRRPGANRPDANKPDAKLPGVNRPGADTPDRPRRGTESGDLNPNTRNQNRDRNQRDLDNQDRNRDDRNVRRDGNDRDGNRFDSRWIDDGRRSLGGVQINVGQRSINLATRAYQPAYLWHPNYYAGYWDGFYGGGNYGWAGSGWGINVGRGFRYGYRPLGWGLGAWGLGAVAYQSGYIDYYNPYYDSAFVGYNYAQPIQVVYTESQIREIDVETAETVLDSAVVAFQRNDYDQALDIVNKGLRDFPGDAVLHEFRGLVLFAREDYQQAASTVHAVLAVGPGWNWETVRGFYPDVKTYTTHLRALEAAAKEQSNDAATRFLLAYHYLIGGHQDAAVAKLQVVVELNPKDRVAAELLQMLTASATTETAQANAPPQPDQDTEPRSRPEIKTIEVAAIVGTWKATRDDDGRFELTLREDNTFVWKYIQGDRTEELKGKFTVEDNVLALEDEDGGALVAELTPEGKQQFNFKLLGAPKNDAGLDFKS